MAKLILLLLCCSRWILNSSALPIIDPDEQNEALVELCPPDSHRDFLGDFLGDCQCLPCEKDFPVCDKVLVEVDKGNGLPGSCCPRYECRDVEPICDDAKMRFYKNKCTVCDPCEPHIVQCKEICQLEEHLTNCLTDDGDFKELYEVWTENNGCKTCTCLGDNDTSCQTHQCAQVSCTNPISVEGQCCLICPEELDENGFYYGHLPMGGTTKGPQIMEGDSSAEEETTATENTTLISTTSETSTASTESSTSTSVSSDLSSKATNSTSSVEVSSPIPATTESSSSAKTNVESTTEPVVIIVTSESPDLKDLTEIDVETSSSDSTIETTTNLTTTNESDSETTTDSSTPIEPVTSTEDHITETDFISETTNDKKIEKPTEDERNAVNYSVVTDYPITHQPAAVAPESTSQVKDLDDSEDLYNKSAFKNDIEVPQEQIKTDFTWVYLLSGCILVFVFFLIIWAYRNYFESKKIKYDADSTTTVTKQPRESVALLNPVRK
ncbi:uncharacterized protein LOC108100675 [Drosophila ficusphila]|uniref:uncharacterized protein LOC108100675 n=1 Tax=Drosophila ficusphila TaxID=30025 RepID=UPI0007E5F3E8|nr:uncharacterized protein LOC108100675 [Drosophila ficusphila]